MISNNSTYKLKASKSSRDFHHDYSPGGDQSEENHDAESLDGDATGDSNRRFNFYNSRDGRYRGVRSRQTEYKSTNRGNDSRRGSSTYRGGRGITTRRNERDYGEGYVNHKYQDGLNRNSEGGTFNYHHSKYYDSDKKPEIKFNLPEDTRISKLLRRLSIESDQENSLTISKKLLEVLMLPDNAHYVRKAFHILGESMLNIFHTAPGLLAKKQSSRCFGRMGYIMGQENDFERFQNFLFSKMNAGSEDLQHLFMGALKEIICLEIEKPVLQKHALDLMRDLVLLIEITDNVDVFKGALENLMSLVEIYPEEFYGLFRDTIDLLFGWHVDHTQPLSNVEFISKNMQRISKHFQMNLEFSMTLVLHFVEDIETYTNQLYKRDSSEEANENSSIEHVTVFILALNTVLRCLGDSLKPANNEYVTLRTLQDCLKQIITTATDTLEQYVPDNLTIAANECISILLEVVGTKANPAIFNLIDLELSLTQEFSDATIISMFLMISKVVKEISANLPIEIIPKLVGPNSEMIKYRRSFYTEVQDAVICVYQSLLNLKNIPLLQEAYRYILGDLEMVFKLITPNIKPLCVNNPFTKPSCDVKEAEVTVLFLLRCLSQLANASGSIIGMWALKPSILELLGVLLEPQNKTLTEQTPVLQYTLLYLLFCHCKCYNYFISSSCLVTKNPIIVDVKKDSINLEDVGSKSPNSGNLSVIFKVIYKTLCNNEKLNLETILLLLNWLEDILTHSYTYLEVLHTSEEFCNIADVLIKIGYNKNTKVAIMVCRNLEKLLSNKQLCLKNGFLLAVTDLCVLHTKSNDENVRKNYVKLSINVPWDITIMEYGKICNNDVSRRNAADLNRYDNYTVTLAQNINVNNPLSEMLPFHFKTLIKYLLNEKDEEEHSTSVLKIEDIFVSCFPIESESQILCDQFRELALASRNVLNNWCTWEAAQFCVNNKLRTPLGKPNDTFTSFENALREWCKSLNENNKSGISTAPTRVYLLLQFMEHLEILIKNASDGSAMGITQPPKPVRSFFTTNSSTCKEWLSRMRIIVIQLALHTGQSTIALRHGYALLKDLFTRNKCNGVNFERAVIYVTLALLNLGEAEALNGLYLWLKNAVKSNFKFINVAAEQANNKYESAIIRYRELLKEYEEEDEKRKSEENTQNESEKQQDGGKLQDDKKKDVDINARQFVMEQLLNCYKEMRRWSEMSSEKLSDLSFSCINPRYAKKIYDVENNVRIFNELNSWQETTTCSSTETQSWSIYETYRNVESDLYDIAYNIGNVDNALISKKLNDVLNTIHMNIQENVLSLPSEFLQHFCLLNYVTNGLKNVVANNYPANSIFLVSDEFETRVSKIDSKILTKILWWSEYFANVQTQGFNAFNNNLRLNIIKKGRKEKNFDFASQQLFTFLQEKELFEFNDANTYSSIKSIANVFVTKIQDVNVWSVDMAKVLYEMVKLIYEDDGGGDSRPLTFNLCAVTSTSISKYAELYGGTELREISSKILLKLAKWLQTNEQVSLTEIESPLGKFLMVLPEIGMIENSNVIPMNEMAIGKLLQFSVHQCVSLSKAWYEFGTWCYRWGRKVIGKNSDINLTLTEEDRSAIENLLPENVIDSEDLNKIFVILSQTRVTVDDEDIDSNEINTSEMILSQLKDIPMLHDVQLHNLVQIWKKIQKRVYIYYELSADSYFRYLHLVTNSDADNFSKNAESNSITVTLRLLRLIVKHALELQNVLEGGLASTPTRPWKVIIPQLFSRLNHPEVYVRQRVSELLRRIAEDAPHLITFPAVVGALEGGVKFDFSEITLPKDCLSQSHENTEEEFNEIDDNYDCNDCDETKNDLQACFKSMVDNLSKQAPETINQVQLFVKELRRIILLWDELWLGTLAQHHSEINKRQSQLELEIEKLKENFNLNDEERVSLITEKHRIIIKPIIYIIEQLHDITSVEPETPHEKKFQERYSEFILEVLSKLKNPANPEKPEESWQLIKSLQAKFQQKTSKGSYTLKMAEISPILAGLRDTVIAMPGSSSTKVTISHVSNHVSILPTKTKPKKLVFHGSDGQSYTYLFKGLEDLHLDERIMQFLSIANTMMSRNNSNLYRARHYSVIPLGPRSGLISWVDGTTPVFALYKRWQQRETNKNNKNAGAVLRPSELFYHKLNPLLQKNGIKNPENRKEWPFSVLKQVLTELMAETPTDLIKKELWCRSINAGVWWQMTRKYSYSVAVMSIIGYIIGLGDRHLDNVLIDLNGGEVVHIDYNVCFEKGKTLRVPEKVPFRLTPNFVDALGVTGTEGIFRLTCENVLKTMKKGRETLLTLLEAFVYDPLVDWTVGGGSLAGTTYGGVVGGNTAQRQTHKELERDVTLSMYGVRCTELKIEWEENRQGINEKLPIFKKTLFNWLEENKKLTIIEDWLQDLHQQMALVKEAEANGISKHSIYSLPGRYETYKKKREAMTLAKKNLEKMAEDCDGHLQKYSDALKILESAKYNEWFANLNDNANYYDRNDSTRIFDLVKEFLQNAGKSKMIEECEQSEKEIGELAQEQTTIALNCLRLLRDYTAVLSQCPSSFIERHRMFLYLKWCKYLQQHQNLDACDTIYQQIYSFLEIKNSQLAKPILKFSYHLSTLFNDAANRVTKTYEDLTKIDSRNLERAYEEAKTSANNFLRIEKGAASAFEFVVVSELLILNQNFLSLETAASRSGDYLLKLTFREGDWFLDELKFYSDKTIELLSYLPERTMMEDAKFAKVIAGIRAANHVYKSIQDLNYNFHTIILPETKKRVLCDEMTVIQMIKDVNDVIINAGMPLTDLIAHLEKNLTCIVMKMDANPTHNYVTNSAKTLKAHYNSLFPNNDDQQSTLTAGKMLLMGFNGLFDKLDAEFDVLTSILCNLEVALCWRKLDQVKDAKTLSGLIFDPQIREILSDIFFLKRLQAISEFFGLCVETCQSFRGLGVNFSVLTDEQLNKPIRKYTADYISRQFLGITTEGIAYTICFLLQHLGLDVTHEIEQKDIGAENKVPLDELYHKSWNAFLKNGVFTQNVLAQASSLEMNLKTAWEKMQEPKKIEQNLALFQSTLVRLQNQTTLHFWINENILQQNSCSFTRSKFVANLCGELTNLKTTQNRLKEKRDEQKTLIASVEQRLNWAIGANPDINEVSSAFETSITSRDEMFETDRQIVEEICSTCRIVIEHELLTLPATPEAKNYDKQFLSNLDKFRSACQYYKLEMDAVSPVEENIMQLYTPELLQNPRWVSVISERIQDIISEQQNVLVDQKLQMVVAMDGIIFALADIKTLYEMHAKVMGEFKTLLKSLTKIDEYAQKTQRFITNYRKFVENFAALTSSFRCITLIEVEEGVKNVTYLEENLDEIYDDLMDLKNVKLKEIAPKLALMKQDSGVSKGQQKNAYAVGVWRRVRMKLEGRDPDAGRKYLTHEQVDYVIREATNLDNLALLYEGWTPWV